MRVLHVVQTADGADWAAEQAAELVKLGVEVHVALPRAQGRTVQKWVDGGAVVNIASTDHPEPPDPGRTAKTSARNLKKSTEYRAGALDGRRRQFIQHIRRSTEAWMEDQRRQ